MTVFGIDWSMESTGLVSFDGEAWDKATIKTTALDSSRGAFVDRMDDIAAKVIAWCDPREGDVLCLEQPAFAAKSSSLDRMFGGWWILYRALREHHAEPWVITPGTVKQLATGNGNASKDAVLIQTVKRLLPHGVDVENNDEADAAWLTVAAAHIAGINPVKLPAAHIKGLDVLIRNRTKETP